MKLSTGASWCVSIALLTVARPLAAQAGVPVGVEFRVNTYTTSFQEHARVASDSSGNFVVVWHSNLQDGSVQGVFGQRYASSGAPAGTEFRVNTYTSNGQANPSVAADSSGDFVVVWLSSIQDGSVSGVFGQRYLSSGARAGTEFRVNTYTTNWQNLSSVASDSSGDFVVVWQSNLQDGSNYGIFGQRYASSGAPAGAEFRVNTYTTNKQGYPRVASDSSGNFVVVWQSYAQDGPFNGVFGQRYASSGAPAGPEFPLSTYTTAHQHPSVASDSSGNFVVVWESLPSYVWLIFGQRFGNAGAPIGSEFQVDTYTTYSQDTPSVASDPSGNFVVVWQSRYQDGASNGVFGRRYTSSGAAAGAEFQVNTYTTNYQGVPSVASDASGNFVVVWQSTLQDGSNASVFGQRYGKIVPVELIRFTAE